MSGRKTLRDRRPGLESSRPKGGGARSLDFFGVHHFVRWKRVPAFLCFSAERKPFWWIAAVYAKIITATATATGTAGRRRESFGGGLESSQQKESTEPRQFHHADCFACP
jgi:hypothetical protein